MHRLIVTDPQSYTKSVGGQKNLMITGVPGSGKTTLIRKVVAELKEIKAAGFYTQEIRKGGFRQGFELIGLDGRRQILSHVSRRQGPFVGKYGVDVAGFEAFIDQLRTAGPADLFVVDEIGKMECSSAKFQDWITRIMDASTPLLATVALRGTPFIERVKQRTDVLLYRLDFSNRDGLLSDVGDRIRRLC